MVWDQGVAGSNPVFPTYKIKIMYEKIIYGETYGYKDFITEEERVFLLESARNSSSPMNVNGSKKWFDLDDVLDFPHDTIQDIRNRIVEIEGLKNFKDLLKSKNFFAEYGKDSECILHKDQANEKEFNHVRYNLMLSKPDRGGQTIHGNDFLDIDERVLWKCFSGDLEHGSDLVMGYKPRSIISMGFLIAK